jgi:hypothetical protein
MLSAHVRPVVSSLMQAWVNGEPSLRVTAKEVAERNLAIAEARYGAVTPTMPLFTAGAAAAGTGALEAIA